MRRTVYAFAVEPEIIERYVRSGKRPGHHRAAVFEIGEQRLFGFQSIELVAEAIEVELK